MLQPLVIRALHAIWYSTIFRPFFQYFYGKSNWFRGMRSRRKEFHLSIEARGRRCYNHTKDASAGHEQDRGRTRSSMDEKEIRQYEPNFKNPQVEVDNGTYSVNGNKLTTFDSEGERDESTFSISGKKLTITYIEDGQEVKMTLTRVDDKEINKYL